MVQDVFGLLFVVFGEEGYFIVVVKHVADSSLVDRFYTVLFTNGLVTQLKFLFFDKFFDLVLLCTFWRIFLLCLPKIADALNVPVRIGVDVPFAIFGLEFFVGIILLVDVCQNI